MLTLFELSWQIDITVVIKVISLRCQLKWKWKPRQMHTLYMGWCWGILIVELQAEDVDGKNMTALGFDVKLLYYHELIYDR